MQYQATDLSNMDKLMNARRCKDGVKVDERGNRDARDMGEDFVMVDSKDVDYVETLLEGEDDDVMYISRKEEEEVLKTGTVALEEQVASIENPVSVEDTATTVMQDNLLEGDNAIDAIVEDVLQGDDTTVTDTLLEEVGTALLEHDVLLNALRTDEEIKLRAALEAQIRFSYNSVLLSEEEVTARVESILTAAAWNYERATRLAREIIIREFEEIIRRDSYFWKSLVQLRTMEMRKGKRKESVTDTEELLNESSTNISEESKAKGNTKSSIVNVAGAYIVAEDEPIVRIVEKIAAFCSGYLSIEEFSLLISSFSLEQFWKYSVKDVVPSQQYYQFYSDLRSMFPLLNISHQGVKSEGWFRNSWASSANSIPPVTRKPVAYISNGKNSSSQAGVMLPNKRSSAVPRSYRPAISSCVSFSIIVLAIYCAIIAEYLRFPILPQFLAMLLFVVALFVPSI